MNAMKKWFACAWIFLFSSVPVLFAQDYPEPKLETVVEWKPHWALGLVLAYEIDGLRVEFAHPLLANSADSNCNQFQSNRGRIVIVLPGQPAWRYEALSMATAYRVVPGEWRPLIHKTH